MQTGPYVMGFQHSLSILGWFQIHRKVSDTAQRVPVDPTRTFPATHTSHSWGTFVALREPAATVFLQAHTLSSLSCLPPAHPFRFQDPVLDTSPLLVGLSQICLVFDDVTLLGWGPGQAFEGCPLLGFIAVISRLDGVMGFGEENHTAEVSFSDLLSAGLTSVMLTIPHGTGINEFPSCGPAFIDKEKHDSQWVK